MALWEGRAREVGEDEGEEFGGKGVHFVWEIGDENGKFGMGIEMGIEMDGIGGVEGVLLKGR